ncbi:MAG: hypothetical protein H6815_03950 [Phycisphaeraceae bacterium]|nr:hypothetical protein [Phycisphaerales bacterium]MCB9859583.1 hypothetical protein [Phycisphaeraceae bacterium]
MCCRFFTLSLVLLCVRAVTARAHIASPDEQLRSAYQQVRLAQILFPNYASDMRRKNLPASMDDINTYLLEETLDPSLFDYIASDKIIYKDIPRSDLVAIVHMKFDRAIHFPEDQRGPERDLVVVGFADGSVEIFDIGVARVIVRDSKQALLSMTDDASLPESWIVQDDLAMMHEAFQAYAKDHEQLMPASLGELLEYIPQQEGYATPRERASAFVMPAVRALVEIPDNPTSEWIDAHTSYVYLGHSTVPWNRIVSPDDTLIVHAKPEFAIDWLNTSFTPMPVVLALTAHGDTRMFGVDFVKAKADESRMFLAVAADEAEHTEYLDVCQDLNLLFEAVMRYTADHNDRYPSNLRDVIAYLPEEAGDDDASRMRTFLPPSRSTDEVVRGKLTEDWVRQHCRYRFIGNPRIFVPDFLEQSQELLLYSPKDETFHVLVESADGTPSQVDWLVVASAYGLVMPYPPDQIDERARESREAQRAIERAMK